MKSKMYTLITGASRGLGKALAEECARRRLNLLLVSLPNEQLRDMGLNLLLRYRIDVETFELDLTREQKLKEFIALINKRYQINMLINNAGTGGTRTFVDTSPGYLDNMLQLNIRVLVMLTHGLMQNLKQCKQAYILNIASMASFGPIPFKTVYPASKAFVYSFTRGLQTELKGSGISISVAHPGGMATNPEIAERINRHPKLIQRTILSPEKTAHICIRRLLQRDELIIPGWMNKISYLCLKTCPIWLQLLIFRSAIKKELPVQKLHYV